MVKFTLKNNKALKYGTGFFFGVLCISLIHLQIPAADSLNPGLHEFRDYFKGIFYLKSDLEDDLNLYTTKVKLEKTPRGMNGWVWSRVEDSYLLRLSHLELTDGRLDFSIQAVDAEGRILATRECRAVFEDNPDRIPYQCRFTTGPGPAVDQIQTGFMIRDVGQPISRFKTRAEYPGPCFLSSLTKASERY